MKCIKGEMTGNKVVRVRDDNAERAVAKGLAVYCPKSEWKALRTVPVTQVTLTEGQSREATRKADKKKMQKDKRDYRKA